MKKLKAHLAGCLLGSLCAASAALAAYPDKPVKLVVPYPPGGASDTTARLLSEKLNGVMGGNFVVENRPGANGNIAADYVAKASPDGYTLLVANVGPNAINQSIYPNLSYDVNKSFAPVTQISTVPIVLVAGPQVKARNIDELVKDIKASPGKYTFASAGNGASNHLVGEMFAQGLELDMMHVPYQGDTPAMTDVMSGQVSMMFATAVAARPHIDSGKVRVMGVATKDRVASLPDAPTIDATVLPGFDAASWGGIVAPAGTPPDVVNALHDAIVKIMNMPDVKERMTGLGAVIVTSKPDEFAQYIRAETDKWGAVVKTAGIGAK